MVSRNGGASLRFTHRTRYSLPQEITVSKLTPRNVLLTPTTWQTVGPFFRIGLERFYKNDLTSPNLPGEQIEIAGHVLDGCNQGVPDAAIEIWQADAQGEYPQPPDAPPIEDAQKNSVAPNFRGFGRIATSADGSFHFKTIKPGRVPAPDGTLQAPHIAVSIFMRGLLRRLITRIYFPEDPANSEDFVLNLVEPARRITLIAKKSETRAAAFEWNILLQGEHETVFFDC
jgi:protocatechuate 3,4-dioxygenase alpha subunit